jgi:hypothetical protein
MEQLLTFFGIVFMSTFFMLSEAPALFMMSFVFGIAYYKLVGDKKGWNFPKEIKDRHKW